MRAKELPILCTGIALVAVSLVLTKDNPAVTPQALAFVKPISVPTSTLMLSALALVCNLFGGGLCLHSLVQRPTAQKITVAVCLLSGGVDSTVAATIKAQEPDTLVYLLSFYYGQGAQEAEVEQSKRVADWLLDHYDNVREHFYLTIDGAIRRTKYHRPDSYTTPEGKDIPLRGFVGWRSPKGGWPQAGYPSTRDEVFVLTAAAGVEARLVDVPEATKGEVVLATTGEDVQNFEDIEPKTYTHDLNQVLSKKMMPRRGKPMQIALPFIKMTKADVIRKGIEIGAPLELTWSCYFGNPGKPCGRCDQCRWRSEAFQAAGINDPALAQGV